MTTNCAFLFALCSCTAGPLAVDHRLPGEGDIVLANNTVRGWFHSLGFSHDSRYLVAGGVDGHLTQWNSATWRQTASVKGHEGLVSGLVFVSDKIFVTSSFDRSVGIWQAAPMKRLRGLHPKIGRIMDMDLSPRGDVIACVGEGGFALLAVPNLVVVLQQSDSSRGGISVQFSKRGKTLAVAQVNGTVREFKLTRRQGGFDLEQSREYSIGKHSRLVLHGGMQSVSVVRKKNKLRFLSPADKRRCTIKVAAYGLASAVSNDRTHIAVASGEAVWLIRVPSRRLERRILGHGGGVEVLAFSSDKKWIASAGSDWTVRVRETRIQTAKGKE